MYIIIFLNKNNKNKMINMLFFIEYFYNILDIIDKKKKKILFIYCFYKYN